MSESEEEARERVAQVRATQIFGDTPTDPTIGDVVVPAHDEEAANAAAAAVEVEADDGDDAAADLSPEEAKRQLEPLDAEDAADDSDAADEADADDSGELSAAEKVERIENAESPEEVDELAEGDERVTVQRAAEKKRSSWS